MLRKRYDETTFFKKSIQRAAGRYFTFHGCMACNKRTRCIVAEGAGKELLESDMVKKAYMGM